MKAGRRTRLLALLLSFAAMPVAAQDGSESSGARTPESAQRFLTHLLVRPEPVWHGFMLYRAGTAVADAPGVGMALVPGAGAIKAVTPEGTCQTRLALDQAQVAQRDPGEAHNLQIGGGRTERLIDWSKVETVNKFESTITSRDVNGQVIGSRIEYGVEVAIQGGWQKLRFDLPAQAERDRLAFAIEFLKSACEFKSDTGF